MTDQTPPPVPPPPGNVPPPPPPLPQYVAPPGPPPPAYVQPVGTGEIGKVRSTGVSMLLFVVTLGIYGLVWFYLVHDEMKRHTGRGLGGLVALLLAIFVTPVVVFFTSDEAGKLYAARGQQPPVTALTGLWYFPGIIVLFLPIVWFVKTNGALNEYWKSLGAPA